MQAALWLRLPSVRSMFPYDLYLRLIVVSYLTRENFFFSFLFFFGEKEKLFLLYPRINRMISMEELLPLLCFASITTL